MAAREQSLALTEAYRRHLLLLRQRATVLVRKGWENVDVRDLDGTGRAWAAAAGQQLAAVERFGVTAADTYLAGFVASELATEPTPQGVRVDEYVDAAHVTQALLRSLTTVHRAIAAGRLPGEALGLGLNQAIRTTSLQVLDTARAAQTDLMVAEDRILGWVRVPSGNACGACLAAATGALQQSPIVMKRHIHCRCVKEPRVRDAPERFRRLTGRELFLAKTRDEQDALFAGRGGAEKAELVRSGAVPFDALIAPSMGGITETPLRELAAIAAADA